MKNRAIALLICIMLCFTVFSAFSIGAEAAPVPDFTIEMSAPAEVFTEDNITVTFSLSSIVAPLTGIEFVFYFDNTLLTPVITENTADEMDAFIHASPQNGWEQLCRYDEARSCYFLRFSASDGGMDESTHIKTENDLIIKIPLIAAKEGECILSVPDKDIIGVDGALALLTGMGSDISFDIAKSTSIRVREGSALSLYKVSETAYLTGMREDTSVSSVLAQLANSKLTLTDSNGNTVTDQSGICKTGFTLSLYDGDALLDKIVIIVKGDINKDGKVTPADYLFAKRAFLGTRTLEECQIQAAHVTNSGSITAITYLIIKRHVLGTYDLYS